VVGLAVAGPVSDGLREGVAGCYEAVTDTDELSPERWIFEPANGYAEVYGAYPACGCTCSSTTAAFRVGDGSYRMLSRTAWKCSWAKGLVGDDWDNVLPPDLRETLLPGQSKDAGVGVVSLDVRLPRKGTDTVLEVNLIPMGLDLPCPGRVCHYQTDREGSRGSFYAQADLVKKLMEGGLRSDALVALAKDGPSALSEPSQALVQRVMGEASDPVVALAGVRLFLGQAWERWEVVRTLTAQELLLRWDRERGVFVVVPEGTRPPKLKAFEDYLQAVGTYSPMC